MNTICVTQGQESDRAPPRRDSSSGRSNKYKRDVAQSIIESRRRSLYLADFTAQQQFYCTWTLHSNFKYEMWFIMDKTVYLVS
jgi:hypothetical protein